MSQQSTRRTKLKILLAGIDGSGKTTVMDLLISQLDSDYTILKLGKLGPHVFFKGTKQLAIKHNLYWLKESIRPISTKYRLFGLFLMMNFLYKCVVSNYLGYFTKTADIVMYETDIFLHPAVYVTFHLPLSKFISRKMRLRIFRMLFGSKRHLLIFYLDVDPNIAVERIQKRGDNIHAHENVKDLKKLKEEFDNMISVACESGLDIVKINTNGKSVEDVTNEIHIVVERRLGSLAGVTPYVVHTEEATDSS